MKIDPDAETEGDGAAEEYCFSVAIDNTVKVRELPSRESVAQNTESGLNFGAVIAEAEEEEDGADEY